MQFTREQHGRFLEAELRAQTEAFKQKLDTKAISLLRDREELFVAQYLALKDGELVLKFSNTRGLPRHGDHLYCFTVPKELRDHRAWGERTYGDLVKAKLNFSELVCIWQSPSKEKEYSLVGFRGVEMAFAQHLQGHEGVILLLGPNTPPYEYLANLQLVVHKDGGTKLAQVLDPDFRVTDWAPVPIDAKKNIAGFVLSQLALEDTLIIQGPPGTGKTHLIAELCQQLCGEGKAVLVTSLTNRALIEVAGKPALAKMLREERVFKTNITTDEHQQLKDLQPASEIAPQPGKMVLSTFYFTSGSAAQIAGAAPFDAVIVDEASQALLAMLGAAQLLGQKNIWIGDVAQLPPVTSLNEDKVRQQGTAALVEGLHSLSSCGPFPNYQLTVTHRLPPRAARYTGIFYRNSLQAKPRKAKEIELPGLPDVLSGYFHPDGGPTLLRTDLVAGDRKPNGLILPVVELVHGLLGIGGSLNIAVLAPFVATTKALQRAIFQTVGYRKNILVETVSKVQGLTTDIVIYAVPNTMYSWSLEPRLFNVATSRARNQTIIITDKNILKGPTMDAQVRRYLTTLADEFSFTISPPVRGMIGEAKSPPQLP